MNLYRLTARSFSERPLLSVLDALRVPECRGASSVCHVHNSVLFSPDPGDGTPGGGTVNIELNADKRFTQADLDRIVQERVAKLNDKVKAFEAQLADLGDMKARLATADEEREAAKLEAEMKGKSEVEKLKHQLQIANDKTKAVDTDWQKRFATEEAGKRAAESKFVDHVRRSAVRDALSAAGLAKGAGNAASLAFLSEAQIELDDDNRIKSVSVGGKSFEKPGDAAKHFLTENPFFAAPPEGGSGTPRGAANGAAGAASPTSVRGLLSTSPSDGSGSA